MNHSFSQVPSANIKRTVFNRTHAYKTTFNGGYLIPFYLDEILPGDTFHLQATLFSRMATPIVPLMDNLYMDTFYFFVPNRLIWENWQRFMGEQDSPGDSTDYLLPTMQIGGHSASYHTGKLQDYFGLPTNIPAGNFYTSLPFRAYNLIWNEWFRDQNLQEPVLCPKGDGPDTSSTCNMEILRRGKRHDYFTSALPWPQKGPGVEIPIGTGTVPVITQSQEHTVSGIQQPLKFRNVQTNNVTPGNLWVNSSGEAALNNINPMTASETLQYPTNLIVDLDRSQAFSATINSLRQAFQLQKMYERDARGGTRYVEILRSHFGVISPDARLQRPEYLGGHSQPVLINPVQQTSSSDSTSPQGNLSAFAVTSQQSGFSKSFVEHGYVIGLVSVRADLTYSQGIDRMWRRKTRFDFYWPTLAHLGEQVVFNSEIYINNGTPQYHESAFGYQERFAEYRYKTSKTTNAFRHNFPDGSLNYWHLGQVYNTLPKLGPTFIQENPPIERVVAVPSQPHFILDTFIRLRCARPMPVYSVPGLIDHF